MAVSAPPSGKASCQIGPVDGSSTPIMWKAKSSLNTPVTQWSAGTGRGSSGRTSPQERSRTV